MLLIRSYSNSHTLKPGKGTTFVMRSKEMANDYRYFPDPDLMPVQMDRARVAELEAELPERPLDKQHRTKGSCWPAL